MTVGCIAAGRPGGYFHIDWNGNIAPCVFFPYYIDNINDIYRNNRRLIDVMESKFFRAIRDWQDDYAYAKPAEEMKNLFTPCPIRDHYRFSHRIIEKHSAKPKDEDAGKVILDEEYKRKMFAANDQVSKLLDPVWQREVIEHQYRIDKDDLKLAV
ncbi:MAG: SPASM domain-containing protein [Desulfobacterales bacterium]